MDKRFRVLSLDGGGIKGTFTAAVLAELEHVTGKRVADYFDLIAGTSTGGILGIALGLGLSAAQILQFYRERGPIIFPVTGLLGRTYGFFSRLIRAKRDQSVLRAQLGQVLGSRAFGESKCRLIIPAFDATYGRVFIFKTAHHPRFQFDAAFWRRTSPRRLRRPPRTTQPIRCPATADGSSMGAYGRIAQSTLQ